MFKHQEIKYFLTLFVLFINFKSMLCSADNKVDKPKVILYFDINKTIIAEDPAGDKTVDDVLIHTLAEKYFDKWDNKSEIEISFSEYVKTCLLSGSKHDRELKKARNKKISEFIEFLKDNNHKYYNEVNQQFINLKNKISQNRSSVFESVYVSIDYLKKNNIDFVLVLRTFGKDIDRIVPEINSIYSGFFSWKGCFKNNILELHSLNSDKAVTLKTTSEIYDFLQKNGNMAIQDDWKTWNQNGEMKEFGKLFPIDLNDPNVISMFFDDNAHPKDGILNPRDPSTNNILDVEELIKTRHVCVVDMLEAICDDNYFVKHIKHFLSDIK